MLPSDRRAPCTACGGVHAGAGAGVAACIVGAGSYTQMAREFVPSPPCRACSCTWHTTDNRQLGTDWVSRCRCRHACQHSTAQHSEAQEKVPWKLQYIHKHVCFNVAMEWLCRYRETTRGFGWYEWLGFFLPCFVWLKEYNWKQWLLVRVCVQLCVAANATLPAQACSMLRMLLNGSGAGALDGWMDAWCRRRACCAACLVPLSAAAMLAFCFRQRTRAHTHLLARPRFYYHPSLSPICRVTWLRACQWGPW